MQKTPVIVIFDIGKTNKKILIFNEQYQLVFEQNEQFNEIADEDGFACEDVQALSEWIKKSFTSLLKKEKFQIKAVNFSAYGASFVYIDETGNTIAPLYNYLKPFPKGLQQKFYQTYGGEILFSQQTASPVLGNLNSGMQLYFLKNEKHELFKKVAKALHLPQYLSYLLTNIPATDITSIGCHTGLWDFKKHQYHHWVRAEKIVNCFAPILPSSTAILFKFNNENYISGIGLHDSSAALIPYLSTFKSPFILLSTGTWCISLNPFNNSALTAEELHQDCLCYLSYQGKSIKASRLFAGYQHEQLIKILAVYFNKPINYFETVIFNAAIKCSQVKEGFDNSYISLSSQVQLSIFSKRSLEEFDTYEMAYHQLIFDIVQQQIISTNLVLQGTLVKRIFVDGGFSKNELFMNMLAASFLNVEIFSAIVAQASALGAAMVLHPHWNSKPLPESIIRLKPYSKKND